MSEKRDCLRGSGNDLARRRASPGTFRGSTAVATHADCSFAWRKGAVHGRLRGTAL